MTFELPDHIAEHLLAYCDAAGETPVETICKLTKGLEVKNTSSDPDIKTILAETRGTWKHNPNWRAMDAVDYQRNIRAEWDRGYDDWK